MSQIAASTTSSSSPCRPTKVCPAAPVRNAGFASPLPSQAPLSMMPGAIALTRTGARLAARWRAAKSTAPFVIPLTMRPWPRPPADDAGEERHRVADLDVLRDEDRADHLRLERGDDPVAVELGDRGVVRERAEGHDVVDGAELRGGGRDRRLVREVETHRTLDRPRVARPDHHVHAFVPRPRRDRRADAPSAADHQESLSL